MMRRPGGLLLALPAAAIEEEVLQQHMVSPTGEEPLVGPFTVLYVPAVSVSPEGATEDIAEVIGVLVADMSLPTVSQLLADLPDGGELDPDTIPFYEWDFLVRPSLQNLYDQVQSWLQADQSERAAFYTATEEEVQAQEPPPAAKAPGGTTPGGEPKPKPKKPTVASLATQVETIANTLPSLMDQLTQLSQRQARLEKRQTEPGHPTTPPALAVATAGRSSFQPMDEPQYYCNRGQAAFRPLGCAELGNSGIGFFEGDRSPHQQKAGGWWGPKILASSPARSKGQGKAKEEALAPEANRRGTRWSARPVGPPPNPCPPEPPSEDSPLPGTFPMQPQGIHGSSGTGPDLPHYDGKELEFRPVKGSELVKDEISTLSFSFQTWCMSLTRWVLSAKTAFSKYLASTLRLCRIGPQSSPTALFPLPLPSFAPYAAWVPGGPRGRRKELALNRALHVLVCALNYTYMASSFPPQDLIRRQPNEVQSQALENLRLLLRACDQNKPIHVESSGRKNLVLLSRLQELAQAVDALGLSTSPYHTGRQGQAVPADNTKYPKLSPFGNLNADRLKISGRGHWDAVSYMPPEFQMGYLEPQLLELDAPVYTRGKPNLENESAQEVLKLFKRWDSFGLLALHPASHLPEGPDRKVKIFNAYKSEEWDRQIGDRRLQNAHEARLPGPSKDLPCGPLITRLILPEGHGVKVCITDRSDFYHQMAATYERSRTNAVWPSLKLKDLQGTKAYDDYMGRAAQARNPPDRTVHGDSLNGIRPWHFDTEPDSLVFGSFQSVLQGDHLGVEFGIASHVGFPQEHGLLQGHGRLQTSSLVRPAGLYEGLVIDDYFTIAPVPLHELRNKKGRPSKAYKAFSTTKQAYAHVGLAGSDAKDVVDQTLATVVGAELDSRPLNVQSGTLPVGAPALKRLSLSWVALQAARFAYTTDALHSSMMGALVSACCFWKCTMAIFQELFKVISPLELDTDHPKLRALPRAKQQMSWFWRVFSCQWLLATSCHRSPLRFSAQMLPWAKVLFVKPKLTRELQRLCGRVEISNEAMSFWIRCPGASSALMEELRRKIGSVRRRTILSLAWQMQGLLLRGL